MEDFAKIYFSEVFGVGEKALRDYGAFDVCLLSDSPVFIDPFQLYASEKPEYNQLHEGIIEYLRFLRTLCENGGYVGRPTLDAYFRFPEVKELFMGFCGKGNSGRGLGPCFARALHMNLARVLSNFGNETISKSSHLEKLCVIAYGVGCDCISDFTANLIKDFLLKYTQTFARKYLRPDQRKVFGVKKAYFDSRKKCWCPGRYELPRWRNGYVLLTPEDILTRYDTWINKDGLLRDLTHLPETVGDSALKGKLVEMIASVCDEKHPLTNGQRQDRLLRFVSNNPAIIDWYILHKENHKQEAVQLARSRLHDVQEFDRLFVKDVVRGLSTTAFYTTGVSSLDEVRMRVQYFKDYIENRDGYRMFSSQLGMRVSEKQIQLAFGLVWFNTEKSVDFEVNNGRGPVDVKISFGSGDVCLVEFKLASNKKLEQNLENQLRIYKEANRTKYGIAIIVYMTDAELKHVEEVCARLGLTGNQDIVLIDARPKESASNVK